MKISCLMFEIMIRCICIIRSSEQIFYRVYIYVVPNNCQSNFLSVSINVSNPTNPDRVAQIISICSYPA